MACRKAEKEERWNSNKPQHVSARKSQLARLPGVASWAE